MTPAAALSLEQALDRDVRTGQPEGLGIITHWSSGPTITEVTEESIPAQPDPLQQQDPWSRPEVVPTHTITETEVVPTQTTTATTSEAIGVEAWAQ